jgi:hypothetical protein
MGHDSGSGERGAFAQRSGLGESARDRGPVDLGPGRSVGNQASPNRIENNSPLSFGARRTSGPAALFSLSFFLRSRGRGSPGPKLLHSLRARTLGRNVVMAVLDEIEDFAVAPIFQGMESVKSMLMSFISLVVSPLRNFLP